MKKFKATYTPDKCDEDGVFISRIPEEARTVMVLEYINDGGNDFLLFVDNDNTIKVQSLDQFSNCAVWD